MKKNETASLLDKPIWQMSGRELITLLRSNLRETENDSGDEPQRKTVYGLDGLCELFGCSKSTAMRIKKSGVIDGAISQVNRKIVVDAELALKLLADKAEAGKSDFKSGMLWKDTQN